MDDTTDSVIDELTFIDNPVWEGSTWSGAADGDVLVKYDFSVIAGDTVETRTDIALSTQKVTLTLNADKTFTYASRVEYTEHIDTNYISEPYHLSTTPSSLLAPEAVANHTIYTWGGDYNQIDCLVAGTLVNTPVTGENPLWTVGDTALPGNYNGHTCYPVTYKTTLPANALSGKFDYTFTVSGTWKTARKTNDPSDETVYVCLYPAQSVRVNYTYANTHVPGGATQATYTKNATYADGTVWVCDSYLGINPAGNPAYYVTDAFINYYDAIALYLQ